MRWLPEDEARRVEELLAHGALAEMPLLEDEAYLDEVDVFDLQVEQDASFVAEGFVVHNSEICRFMHGKVFTVGRAMERFREVERAREPELIRDIQPFVQVGADIEGNQVLFYERGGRRRAVARVDEPAVGLRDMVGRYSRALSPAQLEAAGISVPPLHGRCRSTIVAEG